MKHLIPVLILLVVTPAFAGEPPIPEATEGQPYAIIKQLATGPVATVTWTDNSNNETGFFVQRACTGEADFVEIGRVDVNVTSFANPLDSSLAGKTCAYRVSAFNSAGNSPFSNIASCVVPQPPATIPNAPTNAQVSQ